MSHMSDEPRERYAIVVESTEGDDPYVVLFEDEETASEWRRRVNILSEHAFGSEWYWYARDVQKVTSPKAMAELIKTESIQEMAEVWGEDLDGYDNADEWVEDLKAVDEMIQQLS